jgi:hypothetical protein
MINTGSLFPPAFTTLWHLGFTGATIRQRYLSKRRSNTSKPLYPQRAEMAFKRIWDSCAFTANPPWRPTVQCSYTELPRLNPRAFFKFPGHVSLSRILTRPESEYFLSDWRSNETKNNRDPNYSKWRSWCLRCFSWAAAQQSWSLAPVVLVEPILERTLRIWTVVRRLSFVHFMIMSSWASQFLTFNH